MLKAGKRYSKLFTEGLMAKQPSIPDFYNRRGANAFFYGSGERIGDFATNHPYLTLAAGVGSGYLGYQGLNAMLAKSPSESPREAPLEQAQLNPYIHEVPLMSRQEMIWQQEFVQRKIATELLTLSALKKQINMEDYHG
jgi:hypothetical protein